MAGKDKELKRRFRCKTEAFKYHSRKQETAICNADDSTLPLKLRHSFYFMHAKHVDFAKEKCEPPPHTPLSSIAAILRSYYACHVA